MKHHRTLYGILGVSPDADPDVVRAAYRALAKKYHPDVARKFQMSDFAFRAIAEAYAVLSDVEKRRIYDASLDKLGANTARTLTDEAANAGTRSSRSLSDKLRYGAAALLVFGVGGVVLLLLTLIPEPLYIRGPIDGPEAGLGGPDKPRAPARTSAPSALSEFDRRDRPLPVVAPNRNAQTVKLVQPNPLHRPGLSISKNDGLADKLRPGLFERAKDR
jgi:hypothetical protein